MSRFSVFPRVVTAVFVCTLGSVLAACGAASGSAQRQLAPPPSTAVPTTVAPPSTAVPATVAAPDAPDPVTTALHAVFDRPSGGIDQIFRTTSGDFTAVLHENLRWEGETGTLRRSVSFEGLPESPEARELRDHHAALDEHLELGDRELSAMIERLRAMLTGLASGDLADRGGGWWRGLVPDTNGQASVAVLLVDAVEEVTLDIVGFGSTVGARWVVV